MSEDEREEMEHAGGCLPLSIVAMKRSAGAK
jgi:hypothetical protein